MTVSQLSASTVPFHVARTFITTSCRCAAGRRLYVDATDLTLKTLGRRCCRRAPQARESNHDRYLTDIAPPSTALDRRETARWRPRARGRRARPRHRRSDQAGGVRLIFRGGPGGGIRHGSLRRLASLIAGE